MDGVAELRDRVRVRGYDVSKAAADLLVDRMTAEAGPTLRPEWVRLDAPRFRPERWTVRLEVTAIGSVWQWQTGDPATPFDPHHDAALDGVQFDDTNWRDVLAKDPGVFPVGNMFWFPGDHRGCQCEAVTVVGDEAFNPDGARTSSSSVRLPGGGTVTATRSPDTVRLVPAWWADVVNGPGWAAAVEDVI